MEHYPALKSDWRSLIDLALEEDIGSGDATTLSLVPPTGSASARIVTRAPGVISGGLVAAEVFRRLDPNAAIAVRAADGREVEPNDVIMEITGLPRALLMGERTALNFMQRMSGIATMTARYVTLAAPYGVAVLDTRKTTPLLRSLEKYAVRCGGGLNHRMGLFDRIMVKDNHLAFWRVAGGGPLSEAVKAARTQYPGLVVQVEVDCPDQLDALQEGPPDWVLLDNMSPEEIRVCVSKCEGLCQVEVSGGITLGNVADYAAAGPDAISVGALTHSVKSLDLGMDWVS